MEINQIVRNVLFRFPLFGNIIINIEFRLSNESVPAVAWTNGKAVLYKKELLNDYDDEETEFIIAHEIMHIALRHIFRNLGKDQDLLNYVEDGIINQYLIQAGMKMPKDLVDIPDALDFSTDELYMRYLSKIKEIKDWMDANTYHVLFDMIHESLEKRYQQDLQELMNDNQLAREELLDAYSESLKIAGYGNMPGGQKFPSIAVGTQLPLAKWIRELKAKATLSKPQSSSFCEVEMDGVIRKEELPDDDAINSEILIDTSGSMSMWKIKTCLKETKNILALGTIRVGFFDTNFYEWHEINSDADIDALEIVGRGGTDFTLAAETFNPDTDNKIVLTDGGCHFPLSHPDIIWVVINNYYPNWIQDKASTHIIFVDERELVREQKILSLIKQ